MKLQLVNTPNIEKGRLSKKISNKNRASAPQEVNQAWGGAQSGAIEIAVLDGLGDVAGRDRRLTGQIGNRTGNFKNPVVGPGAEAQFVDRVFKQIDGMAVDGAVGLDQSAAHLGIAVNAIAPKALTLNTSGPRDPRANNFRRLPFDSGGQITERHRRDFNVDVDPIHQGAGDFRAIALDLGDRTATGVPGIPQIATRAGVHRGHQHKGRG